MIDALLVDSWQQLGDVNAQELDGEHENEHEASNQVKKSSGKDSAQHDDKDWNLVALKKTAATSMMTSFVRAKIW